MEVSPIDKKTVADNLAAFRKTRFKSRSQMAEALGMTLSRYSEYEQGRVSLPYHVAWHIADIMQCSMDEVGGRAWSPPQGGSANGAADQLDSGASDDPAGFSGSGLDDGALLLMRRIAELPIEGQNAVRDFVSFQESQKEKTGAISGELDERKTQAVAS